MRRLIFTVYGLPVAQARAGRRHFIAGGRACSQAFDPAKSKNWKQDVRMQVLAELRKAGDVPTAHEGPVVMDLFFYLPRPKSLPKRVKHHLKKPDKGNLEKGVEDALKGLIWRDDSQVIDGRTRKQYGDPPRVVIALQLFDAAEPEREIECPQCHDHGRPKAIMRRQDVEWAKRTQVDGDAGKEVMGNG